MNSAWFLMTRWSAPTLHPLPETAPENVFCFGSDVCVLKSVLVKMGGSDTICYYSWFPLSPKTQKQDIYIYMYTKHSNYAFQCCLRTYLSPLFSGDEYGMDLLRLWRAPPLSEFSQTMGVEEKRVCSNSKNWCDCYQNEQTLDLLYPPALGTIPIGLLGLTSLRPII